MMSVVGQDKSGPQNRECLLFRSARLMQSADSYSLTSSRERYLYSANVRRSC